MTEKVKILFVDDEKRILTSLKVIFRSEYQVFTANSGAEALEIVREHHLHAIISDQRMPEMLGHELLREVKQLSPNTMRLLLTGYSDLNAIVSSINDGEVFRYIHKPWDVTEIRSIVASAVQIADNTMSKTSVDEQPVDVVADDMAHGNDASSTSPSPVADLAGAGCLVLNDNPELIEQLRRVCSDDIPVHAATSVDSAIQRLDSDEIAVLITDVSVGGQDTTDFIKLLKQQYPQIMTIVMTDAIDADSAVELINQGQIYRYLHWPASDKVLSLSIKHGLNFYAKNRRSPELLQRHKVDSLTTARDPSLAEKLASRLRSMTKRFRFGLT